MNREETPFTEASKSPFWAFQIAGWALFLLVIVGVNLYNEPNEWSVIILASLVSLLGFGVTALFRWKIRKSHWIRKRPRHLILPVLTGSLLTTAVWAGSFIGLHLLLHNLIKAPAPRYDATNILLTFVNNYFIVLLWSLIYFAYHYFRMAQIARVERYRSEAAMRDAQLNTLKGQINPHFMFNSLNNIRALMLEDVDRSREMLTRLSDLLRYSMSISDKREVSLSEEVAIVYDFLELCKIQYENRLQYHVEIQHGLNQVRIPPMIIQILVENSVKHGISSRPDGGKINVSVRREGDILQIAVANSGEWQPGRKRADSNGIGLPNIRKRLKLIYGDTASLHLRQEEEEVVAAIEIPI